MLVAAGGEDLVERSPVFVWDVMTGRLVNTPAPHHQREVFCLAFSSVGDCLVSAGRFGEVTTWSRDTWEPTSHPFVEGLLDNVLPFSDGRHLALHSRNDDKILLYDLGTRQLTQVFVPRFDREASSMTVLDGLRLAVAVPEGIRIWNPSTRVCDQQLPRLDDVASLMSFCPDLQLLACGTLERNLLLVDMTTGQRVGEPLEFHTKQINSVAFSPDGRLLASASSDHTLRVATGR
ncbi:WD40 repeat domain-containing protein [Kitasatospora sp. NPDC058444]|uniref:WD40 repeat domain-containing protein n=1 Tax=Kitasatospora sp. NPDC058444 TaxID=3346504 RepID=UPI0036576B7E